MKKKISRINMKDKNNSMTMNMYISSKFKKTPSSRFRKKK